MATAQLLTGVWLDKSSVLGEGAFGVVYKGTLGDTPVAIKTIKANSPEQTAELEATLLEEAAVWASVQHPNVVQFYGVHKSDDGGLYLVSELMDGSVEGLLHEEEERVCDGEETEIDVRQKLTMCLHVACALQRLHQLGILHSDLAARNVLYKREVGGGKTFKVTDFGLATVGMGTGAGSSASKSYQLVSREKLPVRWCAPEVLKRQLYSAEADIWSMGVYMWEVFSLGELPYGLHLTNTDIFQKLAPAKSTFRLHQPEDCPDSTYGLMHKCWVFGRKQRIALKDLEAELRNGRNALPKPAGQAPPAQRPPQAAVQGTGAAGRGRGALRARGGAGPQRGVQAGARGGRGAPMRARGGQRTSRGAPAASRGGRGAPAARGSPTAAVRGGKGPQRLPSGSVPVQTPPQQAHGLNDADKAKVAELLKKGDAAITSKDYKRAVALFEEAEKYDSPRAWAELGRCYAVGWGVKEDIPRAVKLVQQAEEAGDALAMHCIGFMHMEGIGFPEDSFKAASYWEMGAKKGSAPAHHNLGWMYAEGISPYKVDMDKAFTHYLAAAELGYAKSMVEVGVFYMEGGPVAVDFNKAKVMLEMAAQDGNPGAHYLAGLLHDGNHGLPRNYAKELEWYKKGDALGDKSCTFGIGTAYENGHGVEQKNGTALHYYRKAAEMGEPLANFRLAQIYYLGFAGQKADTKVALHYLKKAPASQFPRVELYLGEIFENGDNVTRDYDRAKRHYQSGWKAGEEDCAVRLARMYREGHGVPKDTRRYRDLLLDAEKKECGEASRDLGLMYVEGLYGEEEDVQKALTHFKKGARNGDYECKAQLALFWLDGDAGEHAQPGMAKAYLIQAAEQGSTTAQATLGREYSQGGHFLLDEKLAFEYSRAAALSGDMVSLYTVATRLIEGRGCQRNPAEAVPLLTPLAEAGAADPARDLALLYARGDGVNKDPHKAWELFEKARDDDPLVQLERAKMYLSGVGAPKKSVPTAKTLLESAARSGNQEAEELLQSLKKSGRKLPWKRK